jgi:hypothetical protein
MPDFDLDQLDAAFDDFRAATSARVRPPGLAAARVTVRRRKRNRLTAMCCTALAAVVGIPLFVHNGREPVIGPQPEYSMSPTASASAEPRASTSPGSFASASAAAAGDPARKLAYGARWIAYSPPAGNIAVSLPMSQPLEIPFGIDVRGGTAHNVMLTVDVSAILSDVTVVSPGDGCRQAGPKIICSLGTVTAGLHMDQRLTLQPKTTASLTFHGRVKLTVSADERNKIAGTIEGDVVLSNYATAADVAVQSWSVTAAQVGGTATTTVTMHNNGPAAAYLQYQFPSGDSISAPYESGCRLGTAEGTGWYCAQEIAVGATATIQVTYQIHDCALTNKPAPFTHYVVTPPDPLTANETEPPHLKIDGC